MDNKLRIYVIKFVNKNKTNSTVFFVPVLHTSGSKMTSYMIHNRSETMISLWWNSREDIQHTSSKVADYWFYCGMFSHALPLHTFLLIFFPVMGTKNSGSYIKEVILKDKINNMCTVVYKIMWHKKFNWSYPNFRPDNLSNIPRLFIL